MITYRKQKDSQQLAWKECEKPSKTYAEADKSGVSQLVTSYIRRHHVHCNWYTAHIAEEKADSNDDLVE